MQEGSGLAGKVGVLGARAGRVRTLIRDVLVVGLVNRCEDGRFRLRERMEPDEQSKSVKGIGPWRASECEGPAFVEIEPAPPIAPAWVCLRGTLLLDGSGASRPRISVREVRQYPTTGRDVWDEWRLDQSRHPMLELSRAASNEVGSYDRADWVRTTADLEAHASAADDVDNRSPLGERTGIGFGLVPGHGFVTSVSVLLVTDEIRAWLRETEHRVAVFPLIRRPA